MEILSNMKKLIVLTGPTGSGKTEFSLYLAKKINGAIVNADSRNVYKFLDLGTDKPKNLKVENYLFDFVYPKNQYSLFDWLSDVEKIIKKTTKPIIIVGGTWLWIKALVQGWELPKVGPNKKLRKELENLSVERLQEILKKLDPRRFKELKENVKNKRRLIRAIEIAKSLGKVPKIKKKKKYEILLLAIKRKKLEKIIKKRILDSIKNGLIDEIKNLHEKKGISYKKIQSFGLRYRYFTLFLLKKLTLKEAVEKTYKDTLKYAKTQIREIKKLKPIWISKKSEALKITKNFLKEEVMP